MIDVNMEKGYFTVIDPGIKDGIRYVVKDTGKLNGIFKYNVVIK